MNCRFLIHLLIILIAEKANAINYTWTGASDSLWSTTGNWTPNGNPGASDTITIISGGNHVSLVGDVTVKKVTMSTGTLNCNTYELTSTGAVTFSGGVVSNGTVVVASTGTSTFSGTTFNAKLKNVSGSVYFNGGIYNDSVYVVKKGTGSNSWYGGNKFNGYFQIFDSINAQIIMSATLPDTFNNSVYIAARYSGGTISVSTSSGNYYQGTVTIDSRGGSINVNSVGTSTFNADLYINSMNGVSSSAQVTFGNSTGSAIMTVGHSVFTGTYGISSFGVILKNFTQLDTSVSNTLTMSGTTRCTIENSSFSGRLTVTAPYFAVKNSNFYNNTIFTSTGTTGTNISYGGNSFYKRASYFCSSATLFSIANTLEDNYFGVSEFNISGNCRMSVNNGVFFDTVLIVNNSINSFNDALSFSGTGWTLFYGSVVINNHSSSLSFGASGGTTDMSSATLTFSDSCTGKIVLKNIQGPFMPITINQPYLTKFTIGPNAYINEKLFYYGKNININSSFFADSVSIVRFGSLNDTIDGGNYFFSSLYLMDSTTASCSLYMAKNFSDQYFGNVYFLQKGNGSKIFPSYTYNSTFKGNLNLQCVSNGIEFGKNGGRIEISGTGNQELYINSGTPILKRLKVDKGSGIFNVNSSLTILATDTLLLSNGIINVDTGFVITIADSAVVSDGNDDKFVMGKIAKVGNDSFVFPLGSNLLPNGSRYHPLEISAPSSISDVFIAEYVVGTFDSLLREDTLEISQTEYWRLTHENGGSSVNVTLNWNANSNMTDDEKNMVVASNGSGTWGNLGQSSLINSGTNGKISSSGLIYFTTGTPYILTLGKTIPIYYATLRSSPDGGYYSLRHNRIYFKFNGNYNAKNLNYKIYGANYSFTLNDDPNCTLVPSLVSNYGDNRFYIDLTSCSNGQLASQLVVGKKYTLEVETEKKEKLFLRFKY